ncbi:Response regulator receiver domain protein,histidine kinase [Beggiatoa alba B18LD]|uniref:Response regulator receiver domain protein,histidine kinase n=2 Tax=Beggiatoa alba TaxID=1022 RepID=I3CKU7_9GAMM|nr:Response regulator receiver domain protein,histidine kinase [Beggiatoa alba B18LD]
MPILMKTPQQPHILLIDKDTAQIQLIETALRSSGYQVILAQTQAQLMDELANQPIDIILLNCTIDSIPYLEWCQFIGQSPQTANIPLILLVTAKDITALIQGIKSGAVGYLFHPLQLDSLRTCVTAHLSLRTPVSSKHQELERKALLHLLCHDLTTPLSAVVSLLSMSPSADMLMRMQSVLLESAQSGLELIDIVRGIRELQEKQLCLSPVCLLDTLNASLLTQKNYLIQKNITVNIDIPAYFTVLVEPYSFSQQVLTTLLNNAIKFSYPNSYIQIQAFDLDEKFIILNIKDYGIGMSEKLCPQLFDLNKTTARMGAAGEPAGSGYRLALVSRLMLAYQGSIHVQSKVNTQQDETGGTTVSLRLQKVVI